jgi:hypothetical protein
MMMASGLTAAARPTIYAQADSITSSQAASYARTNAIEAAGGPLLPLLGAQNLAELQALPAPALIVRLLSAVDSARATQATPRQSRTFEILSLHVARDSTAVASYRLEGTPTRTVHLLLRRNRWFLGTDGLIALLELAGR